MKTLLLISLFCIALYSMPVYGVTDGTDLWEPEIWKQFKASPETSNLYDFSYAGYKHGEDSIPHIPVVVNVADYGAIADDNIDDTKAIQNALNFAGSQGGGAVQFDNGKYLMNALGTGNDYIMIPNKVVLRGQGSSTSGTILYLSDTISSVHGQPFVYTQPIEDFADVQAYTVTADAYKGSKELKINKTEGLTVGDVIRLRMYNPTVGGVRQNTLSLLLVAPLQPEPEWTNFAKYAPFECAFTISEIVDGTTLLLKEPLMEDILTEWDAKVQKLNFNTGIGIEDIRFESAYTGDDDGIFSHHGSWEGDYGWCAIGFKNVKDGWVRNVVVNDVVWDINLSECMNITVENIVIQGTEGHHGIKCDNSWFNLVRECNFKTYRHHVVGMSSDAHANVFSNITLDYEDGMIDFHGAGFMSNNLFENINNIQANGGAAVQNVPHAGHYNVFWNLTGNVSQTSKKPGLDFFSGYWNYPSIKNARGYFRHDCYKIHPKSIMVGVHHPDYLIEVDTSTTDRDDEWIYIEGFNRANVSPSSLYIAQYRRRITNDTSTLVVANKAVLSNAPFVYMSIEADMVFTQTMIQTALTVYDLSGKSVYQTQGDFYKNDCLGASLPSGLYLVHARNDGMNTTQKIVVR